MCGCNKRSTVAAMSNDFTAAPGMPRFKVVSKTETDSDSGEALVLSTHPDYRSASIARETEGGLIRVVK